MESLITAFNNLPNEEKLEQVIELLDAEDIVIHGISLKPSKLLMLRKNIKRGTGKVPSELQK